MLTVKREMVGDEPRYVAYDEEAGIEGVELTPNKDGYAKLPNGNSSNRTWIKWTEVEKITTEKELPYHNPAVRRNSALKGKTWVDFLSEGERASYEELKAIGTERFEAEKNREPTEEEKLAADIARKEKELARMKERLANKAE